MLPINDNFGLRSILFNKKPEFYKHFSNLNLVHPPGQISHGTYTWDCVHRKCTVLCTLCTVLVGKSSTRLDVEDVAEDLVIALLQPLVHLAQLVRRDQLHVKFTICFLLICTCFELPLTSCSNGSFLECSPPTVEARVRFLGSQDMSVLGPLV